MNEGGTGPLHASATWLVRIWSGPAARARTATRICDGRPLAAAGVKRKSVIDGARPAKLAASRGSASAGVKADIRSTLSEMGAGLGPAARAIAGAIPATATVAIATAPSAFSETLLPTPKTPSVHWI